MVTWLKCYVELFCRHANKKYRINTKTTDSQFFPPFVAWRSSRRRTEERKKTLANFFELLILLFLSFGIGNILIWVLFFMEIDILSTWIIKWANENRVHDEVVTFTSSVQIMWERFVAYHRSFSIQKWEKIDNSRYVSKSLFFYCRLLFATHIRRNNRLKLGWWTEMAFIKLLFLLKIHYIVIQTHQRFTETFCCS